MKKEEAKYKKFFLVMLSMVLLGGAASLVSPFFLQVWESKGIELSITRILFLMLVLTLSKAMTIILAIYREKFAKEYNKRNFKEMMAQYLNMDYDSIIQKGPANMLDRITKAVLNIYDYMTGDFIKIWSNIIVAVACLLFMAGINHFLALFLLLVWPVNYAGYRALNKELARRCLEMQKKTGEGYQEILSSIQQADYIKQCPDDNNLFQAMEPSLEKMYGSMASVNEYAQGVSRALGGVTEIVENFSLIYIVFLYVTSNANPFMLILSNIVLPLYFSSISAITNSNLTRQKFSTALKLQKEMEECAEPDGEKELPCVDTIQIDVNQLQIPGRTIRFDAHAVLKKGDIVQVCGESGTGKSTFAKALVKFRPVDTVWFNQININEVRNQDLRSRVEYLVQDTTIIKGTLRENLFLNKAWSENLEKKMAEDPILQSILKEKDFDTEIMENGANLSGGERQKIAVARALMTPVDVLILDEICSNIDRKAAEEIYDRIALNREDRITFIISHDELPKGLVNVRLNI